MWWGEERVGSNHICCLPLASKENVLVILMILIRIVVWIYRRIWHIFLEFDIWNFPNPSYYKVAQKDWNCHSISHSLPLFLVWGVRLHLHQTFEIKTLLLTYISWNQSKKSSIYYVRNIFRKTNSSNSVIRIRTRKFECIPSYTTFL